MSQSPIQRGSQSPSPLKPDSDDANDQRTPTPKPTSTHTAASTKLANPLGTSLHSSLNHPNQVSVSQDSQQPAIQEQQQRPANKGQRSQPQISSPVSTSSKLLAISSAPPQQQKGTEALSGSSTPLASQNADTPTGSHADYPVKTNAATKDNVDSLSAKFSTPEAGEGKTSSTDIVSNNVKESGVDSHAQTDGPIDLESFDWDDLEKRFEAKMAEFGKEEEDLWADFRGWVEVRRGDLSFSLYFFLEPSLFRSKFMA